MSADPHIHRSGADVVLGLRTKLGHGRVNIRVQHLRCSSEHVAQAVAARVQSDLARFPEHSDRILAISELYAESAIRFARLRARKEVS